MKAIFNSRVIDTSKPLISSSNRAFCYGDGLFETIVTGEERIDLVTSHLQRLAKGCRALGMELPSALTEEYLRSSIAKLSRENDLKGNIRTKLIVWRNEGGLYSPENQSASFYIECKESKKPLIQELENIGISKSFHTQFSPISFAKTTNALTYVMAGKEMTDNGWDEIILTDANDSVSETHISNVFWVNDDQFYTPSLTTGCIEGVMRNHLIDGLKALGNTVNEVEMKASQLRQAQLVFSSNASGLSLIKNFINERKVSYPSPDTETLAKLKQLLQP